MVMRPPLPPPNLNFMRGPPMPPRPPPPHLAPPLQHRHHGPPPGRIPPPMPHHRLRGPPPPPPGPPGPMNMPFRFRPRPPPPGPPPYAMPPYSPKRMMRPIGHPPRTLGPPPRTLGPPPRTPGPHPPRRMQGKSPPNTQDKPWITESLKSELNKKQKLYFKAKKTNAPNDWTAFKVQRKKVQLMNESAKIEYIGNHPEQDVDKIMAAVNKAY